MQAMQTLKTDPTPAVNADGELLDVVQIGYSANSGGVTITIASLVKVVDVHPRSADSPYDWWRARRDLFTISTDLTSGTEADDIWFSRNLEHDLYVFRVTPRIERLVRAAVAEGLHIVNTVD
jgi:hypothetical protein